MIASTRSAMRQPWIARRLTASGLFAATLLVALASTCASASARLQGCPNGRIAFDSVREGNRDIYAIDPIDAVDSSLPPPKPERLTVDGAADGKPSWSPPSSGNCRADPMLPDPLPTFIAFERTTGTGTDIYRLTVGEPGSPAASLIRESATNPAAPIISDARAPAWGPRRWGTPQYENPPIAFERNVAGKRDIFVSNYDGSGVTNLTNSPDADEANPDWDRMGRRLAFDSDRGGRREVWVLELNYDASTGRYSAPDPQKKVTAGPGGSSLNPSQYDVLFERGGDPALTGSIAFGGPDEDGGNSQIHYTEGAPEPIETYTLTSGAGEHTAPVWAPQCTDIGSFGPRGCLIAYQRSKPSENSDIYVMDPFGDESDRNLTQFPGEDANPDWEAPFPKTDETYILNRPRGRRSKRRKRRARAASVTRPKPAPAGPKPEPKRSKCTKTGTARGEVLRGTAKRDVLCGLGGNDRILGLGGNDVLRGGRGNDRLLGGRGHDRVLGEAGNDRLDGGRGRDRLDGGPGRDRINARDRQRDRVFGGRGRDRATVDRRLDRVRGVELLRRR